MEAQTKDEAVEGGKTRRDGRKSGRRRARELALQGLYQWQLARKDAVIIAAELAERDDFGKADTAYFRTLLNGTIENAQRLQARIAPHLDRRIEELSPIERGLLMFGNPETTTGGNALKFYASVRIDIRRVGSIKKGEEVIGSETRAKVVKNKVSPPFRNAEFDILYGEGISREGEIIELGVLHRIIEKSGSWYTYGKDRIGQGKDNAREYLKEHPEVAQEIESKIRAILGVEGGTATPVEA